MSCLFTSRKSAEVVKMSILSWSWIDCTQLCNGESPAPISLCLMILLMTFFSSLSSTGFSR